MPSGLAVPPVWRWLSRQGAAAALLGVLACGLFLGALAGLSGEFALIVGVVVALSAAIVLQARLGVWWLCLLFPLSQLNVIPRQMLGITGFSPINVLLLATSGAVIVFWVLARMRGRNDTLPPVPMPLLALYVLPIALAAVHGMQYVHLIPEFYRTAVGAIAFDSPASYLRDVFVRPMFLVAFALLVAMAFRDARDPRRYLAACIISALLMSGLVFYVAIASGASLSLLASPRARGLLSGLGMHANEISLLLNSALALIVFLIPVVRGAWRVVLIACASVLLAAVLATFSRGGYLGLLLVYLAFLVHTRDWRWVVLSLLAAVVLLIAAPSAVFDRALHGFAERDSSAISAGRLDQIWPLVWPVVLDHIAIGNGLMSILWSEPARAGWLQVAQPHNAYLGLLLDTGLVGFVWIMAFFAWALRTLLAASREATEPLYRQLFLGGVVTVLLLFVQGLSDDRFTPTVPQAFMWFAIGAAIGYRARLARGVPVAQPHRAPAPSTARAGRHNRGYLFRTRA